VSGPDGRRASPPAGQPSRPAAVALLSLACFFVASVFVPGFDDRLNLASAVSKLFPVLAVSLGETFVLLAGGIDLSVTSVIALASVTGARVMTSEGGLLPGHAAAGVAAMLVVGAAVGLVNGLAVARLRIPPLLATLAVMVLASGLAMWAARSRGIVGLPASFRALAGHPGQLLPPSAFFVGALAFAAHLVLRRTDAGPALCAVGRGSAADRASGVPVGRVLVLASVACGMCAAIASVFFTARVGTGSPVLGRHLLVDVIGGPVIGGTSLLGGRGSVLGTASGVLFIAIVDQSLYLLGVSSLAVLMTKGALILAAGLLDARCQDAGARGPDGGAR
jgi:ribose/xylose/arabinose/galactoside ABC-type transport system permease subunit